MTKVSIRTSGHIPDLHSHLGIGVDVVGVAALLAPAALDCVPRHLGVVSGNNGVSGRFLGGKSTRNK